MPRSDFRCLKCKTVLGIRTSTGQLVVKRAGTLVEVTRADTIIHCACGHRMICKGPVRTEPPVLAIQRTT